MGIFDKAKDMLGDNQESVDQGIDQAADFVDEKTGGQHSEQIDQGADFAKEQAGNFLGGDNNQDEPEQPA
ncbi:antitoxin [Microlunatus speluncae]|uniref:antitoxin n=1 Tax=Microlunatus speluncae TaxID=2594267 RepID=UPI0012664EC4|nr:antitoxin [Microlunatus speluncae]